MSEQETRNRPKKSFSLSKESMRIIHHVASRDRDGVESRALDKIVREWWEMKFGKRSDQG